MHKTISLTVNGAAVQAHVEPRLQLADFLRDHLALTGTHLGCEHGVCGACTIQINGAPARSCIAYAVACDGADVRTIEGFDDDPVMADLREAFSAEHALQCGYCTPGMLVTARDIVMRLPGADEARIREELSGNLCRCTGYVGIVRAIKSVLAKRGGNVVVEGGRSSFDSAAAQPVLSSSKGSGRTETPVDSAALRSGRTETSVDSIAPSSGRTEGAQTIQPVRPERRLVAPESKDERPPPQTAPSPTRIATPAEGGKPQTTLHQSFTVDHPREKVWAFFGRLDEVTTCLPGASVVGAPTGDHVDIKLQVKLGPIVPEFAGSADVVRDSANYSGTIRGAARDVRSNSATRGEVRYVLIDEKGGTATRVEVDVDFTLTGALAQFSRSSIVQDIAKRMTSAFARNLEARLNQGGSGEGAAPHGQPPAASLDAGSLFFSVLWERIRAFFGRSRR